jgi:hypothetical protein
MGPPTKPQPQQPTASININQMELTMENGLLPILGVFTASVILLVATINNSTDMSPSMKGYANSVGSISMILSFILLARIKQLESSSLYIRYLLFIWSFIGGCTLTFGSGPFSATGNGYFCSWAIVIFSFLSIGISLDKIRSTVEENANPLIGLGFCGFLVSLSIIPYLGTAFYWESIFGLIVALLTILLVGYSLYKYQTSARLPNSAFNILLLSAILWIFTAGITTFRGPFLVTGNGYFASWGGAILSVIACKEVYQDDGIEDIEMPPSPQLAASSPPASPPRRRQRDDDGTASKTAMMTTV